MHRKTLFSLPVFLLLCFWLSTAAAYGDTGPTLDCKSALLLDGSSGAVLYEMNSNEQVYPASVTKIMTMCLTLEAVKDGTISLEDTVMVSEEAASMGGSQVFLYPGETRTVQEMLIAIAVGSGNDAAYAIAEFIGGTYAGFIDMMNEKAAELGMSGTHFVNPHGLHDPEHYTTAADLGKLAYHAIQLPGFLDYTSIYEYEFRPEPNLLTLWNTNRLLKWYEGADGIKTGYTSEAGRNLVSTAVRDGMRLIGVVMGCEARQAHFKESMNLLNYGFNSFSHTLLHQAGEVMGNIPVSKGKAELCPVILPREAGFTAPKNQQANITEEVELLPALDAPVQAGDVCGKLRIYQDGQELLSFDLVAGETVEKANWFRTWGKLLRYL